MIEKVKRVLKLGAKDCLVCGKSFVPKSGAQLSCSPECKARARLEGLTKRGPRKRGGVDPALLAGPMTQRDAPERQEEASEAASSRQEPRSEAAGERSEAFDAVSQAVEPSNGAAAVPGSVLPDLELDLRPVEAWIRAVVHQAIRQEVRQAVREEIAERLRGLMGK